MSDMPARYLTVMCGMTASYLAGMLGMTAGYIAAGRMTARYLTVMLDVAAKYLTVMLVMTARYVAVMPGPLTHPPPSPQACPGAASFMEVALLSPCTYHASALPYPLAPLWHYGVLRRKENKQHPR
jgi:hypothetical protein